MTRRTDRSPQHGSRDERPRRAAARGGTGLAVALLVVGALLAGTAVSAAQPEATTSAMPRILF